MADLEKLALKRDRGYLVRLFLLLLLGVGFGLFLAFVITGSNVSGCMANAFVGSGTKPSPANLK
jgi:hypothetical protein